MEKHRGLLMDKKHMFKIALIVLLFSCESNEKQAPFTSIMDEIAYFHYGYHGEADELFLDTVSLDSIFMDSLLRNYYTFDALQASFSEKDLANKCVIFEQSDMVEKNIVDGIRSGEVESQYGTFSEVLQAYLGDTIRRQQIEKYETCQFEKDADMDIVIKTSPFYMARERGVFITRIQDKYHLYYLEKRAGFWGFYFVFEL